MKYKKNSQSFFLSKGTNIKSKIPIEVTEVIRNLLTKTFMVCIDQKDYIVDFSLGENGVIAYSWSGNLRSYEILEKAFKEGIWFEIS